MVNQLILYTQISQNHGKPVDIIYLDFAKAFDKGPYQRLLKKLLSHGIGGKILLGQNLGLSGEDTHACLNRKFSDWCNVISGVPQGSVQFN